MTDDMLGATSVHRLGPRWWQLWRRFQMWRFTRRWKIASATSGGILIHVSRPTPTPRGPDHAGWQSAELRDGIAQLDRAIAVVAALLPPEEITPAGGES